MTKTLLLAGAVIGLLAGEPGEKEAMGTELQLRLYTAYAEEWLGRYLEEERLSGPMFALDDLDEDGLLELCVNEIQGSGRYSYNRFFRLSEPGLQLEEMEQRILPFSYSEFDIDKTEVAAYRSEEGIIYYSGRDYIRSADWIGCFRDGFWYLKDGVVYSDVVRVYDWCYTAESHWEEAEEHYYAVNQQGTEESAEEVSLEQWEESLAVYTRGMEEFTAQFQWFWFPSDREITGELIYETLKENCTY